MITPLARGVRFERWITGEVGMRGRDDGVLHDRWTSYDFLIPGVLLMTGGYYEPGTAERLGHQAPDLDRALGGTTFTSQAVTPMEEKTARYFFSWGPHRRHGDEALRDALMKLADMAFGEDKVMIEAQQKVIDRTPDPRIMPTSADKGVTLFNRLVEKLVRAEQDAMRNAA